MRFYKLSVIASGICLLGLVCGCGGGDPLGRRAVSGVVTLDGAPLAKGSISFQPVEQGVTSAGAVITDGAYTISREQGLPKGKYRVAISAVKPGTGLEMPEGGMPGDEVGAPAEELIPAEWNTKSENYVEVGDSGPAEFKHEIVSKK